MDIKWQFDELPRSTPSIDPKEGEFFNSESLDNLANAQLREGGQNTLDVVEPGCQARIRIYVSGPTTAVAAEKAAFFLGGLWPHVNLALNGDGELPNPHAPVPFMVFEDFGTRGLVGDPTQYLDKPGEKNDFYFFWRNVGRSAKAGTDLGRWGVGKTVFPASSRLRTFFGLTHRKDNKSLLMGQAVLQVHQDGNTRYSPYGYFGDIQPDKFALPIEDVEIISEFRKVFHLDRDGQPGLSIVMPYPQAEMTANDITKAAIEQYFYPIHSGKLVIKVETEAGATEINSVSMPEIVNGMDPEFATKMSGMLELTKWAIEQQTNGICELQKQLPNQAPQWSEALFKAEELEKLKKAFAAGDRIGVRVPIWVRRTGGVVAVESFFDVFMERDNTIATARPLFIRRGIMIPETRVKTERNVRALVIAEDQSITTLLGDSENPAHTEWQERSTKFQGKYANGAYSLRFVKNAVAKLIAVLAASGEVDKNALLDLFYLPVQNESEDLAEAQPKDKKKDDAGMNPKVDKPTSKPRPIQISKAATGFSVYASKDAEELPAEVEVRLAYEVRSGNPFKRYQTADFEVDKAPITLEKEDAEVLTCAGNMIRAKVLGPKFSLKVLGFDTARDLRVKATPIADGPVGGSNDSQS